MIKPKSRKHEDRIKALEDSHAVMHKELIDVRFRLEVLRARFRAKKWWKFWA